MQMLKSKIAATLGLIIIALALFVPIRVLADPAPLQQAENQAAATNQCSNTTTNGVVDQAKVQGCLTQSPIVQDIQTIVNFLSAGVGVIVTGVIILGGIQYTLAGDNPQALKAARDRIVNGLIALFAFLFIFAFLQWLIPGGIFK
jgi:type IV secretion system pilin